WAHPLARLMATTRACPRGTARDLLGRAGWCGSRSALHGSTARAAPPWAHPLARLMATTRACPRGTARDLLGCAGWCGSRSALHGSTARAAPPWAHPLARLMATTWACPGTVAAGSGGGAPVLRGRVEAEVSAEGPHVPEVFAPGRITGTESVGFGHGAEALACQDGEQTVRMAGFQRNIQVFVFACSAAQRCLPFKPRLEAGPAPAGREGQEQAPKNGINAEANGAAHPAGALRATAAAKRRRAGVRCRARRGTYMEKGEAGGWVDRCRWGWRCGTARGTSASPSSRRRWCFG